MRQKATTGAPVRSEPKAGKGLRVPALFKRCHSADSSSVAVTTPGRRGRE
jgi:hypothetical protein